MARGIAKNPEEKRARQSASLKGRIPWNKGLTKETDERVAKNSEATSKGVVAKWANGDYADVVYGAAHYIEDRTHLDCFGYPLSYYDIKPLIRDRDGHVCQLCGEPEENRKLDVHHIDHDRTNSDPFNLVSLCRSCHIGIHKGRRDE